LIALFYHNMNITDTTSAPDKTFLSAYTNVEPEVYFFAASVIIALIALFGVIYAKLFPKKKLVIVYDVYRRPVGQKYVKSSRMHIALNLLYFAIVLFFVSFVISATGKRLDFFINVIGSRPTLLLALMMQTKLGYMDVCPGGHCIVYCCADKSDKNLKWKDCSVDCDSPENKRLHGDLLSNDCFDRTDMEGFCKHEKERQGPIQANVTGNLCNSDTTIGAITCTCCMGNDGSKYWDCSKSCSSHPTITGVPQSYNACLGDGVKVDHLSYEKYCTQASNVDTNIAINDNINDPKTNSQTF
jgi:hypothetical protein